MRTQQVVNQTIFTFVNSDTHSVEACLASDWPNAICRLIDSLVLRHRSEEVATQLVGIKATNPDSLEGPNANILSYLIEMGWERFRAARNVHQDIYPPEFNVLSILLNCHGREFVYELCSVSAPDYINPIESASRRPFYLRNQNGESVLADQMMIRIIHPNFSVSRMISARMLDLGILSAELRRTQTRVQELTLALTALQNTPSTAANRRSQAASASNLIGSGTTVFEEAQRGYYVSTAVQTDPAQTGCADPADDVRNLSI